MQKSDKMMRIEIDDIPPSNNHAYIYTRHGCFMTKKGKDFQEKVRKTVRKMRKDIPEWPWKGRIRIDIHISYGDKRKRDIKNSEKLLVDALQKNVFVDDCQIDDFRIRRMDEGKRHIVIDVEEIDYEIP